MIVFIYDGTFEGLLTAVFEAYSRKLFPEKLLTEQQQLPLFADPIRNIDTDGQKAQRVWTGLKKKLSASACFMITATFLADDPEVGPLLFRYICKAIDAPKSIETNFADSDVLETSKIYKKVQRESERVRQFVCFQKSADGIFFAPISPQHNVLPLNVTHFTDRFADQKWVIYDTKREYGYYYDLENVQEVTFDNLQIDTHSGKLNEEAMASDEKLFQQMWKSYFKSMTIKERINPKLHRQHLPRHYWPYLTEKQK